MEKTGGSDPILEPPAKTSPELSTLVLLKAAFGKQRSGNIAGVLKSRAGRRFMLSTYIETFAIFAVNSFNSLNGDWNDLFARSVGN